MTFINWISVSVTAILLIVLIVLKIYYSIKLRNMDGFMGILPPDKEELENDNTET